MNDTSTLRSLDRRNALSAMVSGAAMLPLLAACAAPRQRPPGVALDDGTSELTPAYVVTHTSGRPTMFVRANYFFWDQNRDVELLPEARITVNGHPLSRDPNSSTSMIADVPARPEIEYELVRRVGQEPVQHLLELPYLQIDHMSLPYREGGLFRMSMRAGPKTGPGVIEDSVNMTIFGPRGETRLSRAESSTWPDLTMVPNQRSSLPPGDYNARIYRQQRVSLNRISKSRTGWAVISHGFEFVLPVR